MKQFLFAALLLSSYVLSAQYTSVQIDSLLEDALEKFEVARASIVIVKNGKVIHSKGYGVKSYTTKEKVNKHTQFGLATFNHFGHYESFT
ncbi:hypothetical protein MNBD_BACTEROID03-2393 [hydrothermal vent metagenome]|uniref:Serine hydrolase n=1 Tax=hydrothermal vent metagenome TaxID=652676 RepID=A0A3B0T772_9ZZZZ